jgi:hypothetical protein
MKRTYDMMGQVLLSEIPNNRNANAVNVTKIFFFFKNSERLVVGQSYFETFCEQMHNIEPRITRKKCRPTRISVLISCNFRFNSWLIKSYETSIC